MASLFAYVSLSISVLNNRNEGFIVENKEALKIANNNVIDITKIETVKQLMTEYELKSKNETKLCDIYYRSKFGEKQNTVYL